MLAIVSGPFLAITREQFIRFHTEWSTDSINDWKIRSGGGGDLAPSRRLALHRAIVAATSRGHKLSRISAVETLGVFRDTNDRAHFSAFGKPKRRTSETRQQRLARESEPEFHD